MAFVLSRKPHVFIYVHHAHVGGMARARILLILTRTTRFFLIFVTSAQLINREFLAIPLVIFLKIASLLNSCNTFIPSFFC